MASRYKEWLATWGLSELEMGFRAIKLDESTLDMPKLTGWGNEEAQLEGRGRVLEARKECLTEGRDQHTECSWLKQDVD